MTVLGVGATASAQVEHDSCSGTPAVSNSTTNTGLIADCDILLAAKPILIGDKTQATLNWSPDVAMFRWDGITIDRTFGHVADISLSSNDSVSANDLSGSIPPELGNLTGLETLSLSGNALSGSIPPSLGNLTNLTRLSLYSNELSGSIPPELGRLIKLESLSLAHNRLTDLIPVELGNLTKLESLSLTENHLTGSIPVELGGLANLESLLLGSNRLSGPIPVELSNLDNLRSLWLGDNELSGSIPPELGRLTDLYSLLLMGNYLSGSIPIELSSLPRLRTLWLSNNYLSGSIPPELGNLTNLESLLLGLNGLSGSIPPELGNLTRLDSLRLQHNELSGSIPPSLGNLTKLVYFNLSDNELSGSIPPELDNLTRLEAFGLSGNDLSGCIPLGLTRVLAEQSLGLSACCLGSGGGLDVGVATVVVANGWSPSDVGAASVLAARTASAVVTYTEGDELPSELEVLLGDSSPGEVIIVGGTAAVMSDVCSQVRLALPESDIIRVTGADRADTAARVARRILGNASETRAVTLIVANGWSPPDIGAAAALAARNGRAAVLYTERDVLSESSAALLRDYDVAEVVMIGGTAAISDDTAAQIASAAGAGANISRLTGTGRIDTAAEAARRVLGDPAAAPGALTLIIANGWSPPDIGVAAALAAATENAAVAYTQREMLPEATAALIRDYRPTKIVIIGGSAAVTDTAFTAIAGSAPHSAEIRRITGQTRIHTAIEAARQILARF
ncbi:MAG: leucine-rich repeat domain-containing protein [Acidimicrobiaceae bacterium]|nr:leucine-rich repeat domain-containing protein [Acidimicrobiaceae bacterium]